MKKAVPEEKRAGADCANHPSSNIQILEQAVEQVTVPSDQQSSDTNHHHHLTELIIPAAAIAMLYIGHLLTPATAGVGTHQQLGLPACPFLSLTGFPCPSCGFTTSITYAAHFQFGQSIITQPFGFVIFCLAILSIPFSAWLIARRMTWTQIIRTKPARLLANALIVLFALGWIYKIVAIKWIHFGF